MQVFPMYLEPAPYVRVVRCRGHCRPHRCCSCSRASAATNDRRCLYSSLLWRLWQGLCCCRRRRCCRCPLLLLRWLGAPASHAGLDMSHLLLILQV